jgi:drug/metabolite transporter (DMT)-like permease
VLLVSRSTNAILTVVILVGALTIGRRLAQPVLVGETGVEEPGASRDTRVIALVILAGLLDVLGLVFFMYGLEHAETWLVGLASSFGPAVTIIAAVAFMGERLRGIQWIGLAFVLAGMLAIGLP